MSKRSKKEKALFIEPNVTMEEFLAGETLIYLGVGYEKTEATYRIGDGIHLTRDEKELGFVAVSSDHGAKRVYRTLARTPGAEA